MLNIRVKRHDDERMRDVSHLLTPSTAHAIDLIKKFVYHFHFRSSRNPNEDAQSHPNPRIVLGMVQRMTVNRM